MILPLELLIAVCRFARPEDLKNIRLTCSTLNAVVVPILFDRVSISARENVSELFQSRTVKSKYKDFIRQINVDCCLPGEPHERLSSTYLAVIFIYPEAEVFNERLLKGLRSLQNIHQLSFDYQASQPLVLDQPNRSTITYDERYRSMWLQSMSRWDHKCHTRYTHKIIELLARASIFPLRIVCHENDSQTMVGDLATMDSLSFEFHSETALENAQKVFQAAKVIRLSLRDTGIYFYHWPLSLAERNPLAPGHLPRVLGAAGDLEELILTLYSYYGPPPPYKHPGHHAKMYYWDSGPKLEQHLLGLHTWPRLNSLKLYGCQFFGPDLTDLFDRHRSSLRKVELGYSRMRRSRGVEYRSWAAWLEDLRDTLGSGGLKELDLTLTRVQDRGSRVPLSSPTKYAAEEHYIHDVSPKDLRDFFEIGAENPCQIGVSV